MKDRKGFVYLLRCLVNDKCYVGLHVGHSVETRWNAHINAANKSDSASLLHRAIRKHGVENFSAEILRTCLPGDVERLERYYIKKHKTVHPDGYNLTTGGESSKTMSERSRRKMSAIMKRRWADKTYRESMSAVHKGYKWSEESKAKMSQSTRERYANIEVRKVIGAKSRAHYASAQGLVTKQLCSEASKRRWSSQDARVVHKASISNYWNGEQGAEHRKRRSEISKQLKHSEDAKRRIAESVKRSWEERKREKCTAARSNS